MSFDERKPMDGSALRDAFWFSAVALMWGATNPLLKRFSKGVETFQKGNRLCQFFAEFSCLFFNWKYLASFITNQMGSVVFYFTLASADLTLAVPVTNSLTFIFTALSSYLPGEKNISKETLIGMIFVVIGTSLCVLSELDSSDPTVPEGRR